MRPDLTHRCSVSGASSSASAAASIESNPYMWDTPAGGVVADV